MKIKLNTIYAAPEGCHQPGDTIDVSSERAKHFVDHGFAEYVDKQPEPQQPKRSRQRQQATAKPAAETATK